MKRLSLAIITCFLIAPASLQGQQVSLATPPPQASPVPERDVDSVDSIINALYQVISGPAGQKRDWDRFRSLFAPGARLIPALSRPGEKPVIRVLDVEAYILRADGILEKEDFWESETERKTDVSGNLVHVFSMYESRHAQSGEPFQKGVNSIQLFSDGTRWWIVTVMWNSAR